MVSLDRAPQKALDPGPKGQAAVARSGGGLRPGGRDEGRSARIGTGPSELDGISSTKLAGPG